MKAIAKIFECNADDLLARAGRVSSDLADIIKRRPVEVAALDVGRMDDGTQQQTFGIYREMALLALGLLASVIPASVDRAPPFSALLTLWLSMIAAVGLASRPASSWHFTYSV